MTALVQSPQRRPLGSVINDRGQWAFWRPGVPSRLWIVHVGWLALVVSVANVGSAEMYSLKRFTLGCGAGSGSNQLYRIQSTFGQSDAGLRTSGSYKVGSGFWGMPPASKDHVWINRFSGKWEEPANWNLGAPDQSRSVFITNAGTKTVTVDAATAGSFPSTLTISNLFINSTSGATNTLRLANAGLATPLSVFANLELRDHSAVVVDNSKLQFTGPLNVSSLRIGTLGSGNRVTITNGGHLVTRECTIGLAGHDNTVLVTGPGSLWVNGSGSFSVANSVPGTGLLVANGGGMLVRNAFIGNSANANGQAVIVADPGSTWTNTGNLNVGTFGGSSGAQFVVSNGAAAFSASATVGSPSAPNHTATITGPNSLWLVTNSLVVGLGGAGNQISITNRGALFVTNATHTAAFALNASTLILGSNTTLRADRLILTNGSTFIHLSDFVVGNQSGAPESLEITDNSTMQVAAGFMVAPASGSTGIVTMTSGTLTATNSPTAVGSQGQGSLSISGGTATLRSLKLGGTTPQAAGTLKLSGTGLLRIQGGGCLDCGLSGNDVEVEGGELDASETAIVIGENHNAQFHVRGGLVKAAEVRVGFTPGFTGVMTHEGGVTQVFTNFFVGDCAAGATGSMILSNGTLHVTNAAQTAVLDVRKGSFLMTGGALVVDKLIVTNSCGATFNRTGGALTYGQLILDPNGDADGDGQSNATEVLAGTDPLSADSSFRILSATVTNQNVRVSWTTVGGKNYVLQAATNITGSVTTDFSDLSPVISVGGTEEGTTNYLHLGGGTNRAGFYRVRLVP